MKQIIVITDSENVDEDELIVKAAMAENHIASSGDDNEFMAEMLRSAVKKFMNNGDEEAYQNEIRRNIREVIEEPANDSLAYKIKDFSEEERNKLENTLIAFPKEEL